MLPAAAPTTTSARTATATSDMLNARFGEAEQHEVRRWQRSAHNVGRQRMLRSGRGIFLYFVGLHMQSALRM